jgi:hypothetical protein
MLSMLPNFLTIKIVFKAASHVYELPVHFLAHAPQPEQQISVVRRQVVP